MARKTAAKTDQVTDTHVENPAEADPAVIETDATKGGKVVVSDTKATPAGDVDPFRTDYHLDGTPVEGSGEKKDQVAENDVDDDGVDNDEENVEPTTAKVGGDGTEVRLSDRPIGTGDVDPFRVDYHANGEPVEGSGSKAGQIADGGNNPNADGTKAGK